MKRILVICMALVLALTPATAAEAAKGGKSGKAKAAKTCSAKKAKSKKAKKAKKACKKAAKKKAAPAAPQQAAAEKECRTDRRIDPEGFVTDFGSGRDAVAKCAAELLEQTSGDDLDDELGDEGEEPIEDLPPLEGEAPVSDDEAQFGGEEQIEGEEPLL